MKTSDFICYVVLGIQAEFIDELCDEFDVDFSDDDVKELLNICAGGLNQDDHFNAVGNLMIRNIYRDIIDKYNDVLDEEKFDYYLDGSCSHLYYDGKTIYRRQDLEQLVEEMEMAEEF